MSAVTKDIAIIAFAQYPHTRHEKLLMDSEMMTGVIDQALGQVGLTRPEIDFYCSGSTDYNSGLAFSFVHVIDAIGPWPPAYESHVEMDGAFALYEAWLKLQYEDIETAMVYCWGKGSTPDSMRDVMVMQLDPYYQAPLYPDSISLAGLQAQALINKGKYSRTDFARVAAEAQRAALNNPNAQRKGNISIEQILAEPQIASPLSKSMCCPVSDGAAVIILAKADAAKELCKNPVWIRGIDHRIEPHNIGMRDLTVSPSTSRAAKEAGADTGPIDVAELDAPFAHQQLILQEALGLDNTTKINPSGGALSAYALTVSGLVRIGEAANAIWSGKAKRALAHATSGPCLQQNLVCVLEANHG